MQSRDRTTARGRGTWGTRTYNVEVITHSETRQDSTGRRASTTVSYDLLVDDSNVGRRRFPSEAARSAFVDQSFTGLTLGPVDPPEEHEKPHPLAGLVRSELAVVTFVRDYLQLNFDSPALTLYVWPRIHRVGSELKRSDPGYTDALIGLINVPLTAVDELLDQGLVLDFANGTRLAVPLDGTDLAGPEVAEYADIIWAPADDE